MGETASSKLAMSGTETIASVYTQKPCAGKENLESYQVGVVGFRSPEIMELVMPNLDGSIGRILGQPKMPPSAHVAHLKSLIMSHRDVSFLTDFACEVPVLHSFVYSRHNGRHQCCDREAFIRCNEILGDCSPNGILCDDTPQT